MAPIRRSLVIPNQVPAAGLPTSLPARTQASALGFLDDPAWDSSGPNECHDASVAGLSRYSSRLAAKILSHQLFRQQPDGRGVGPRRTVDNQVVGVCRIRYTSQDT